MITATEKDIWVLYQEGHWIVIPTNIGWKSNGENVMGAGLARDAVELEPGIARFYGGFCKRNKSHTPPVDYVPGRMILFPTKPLNEAQPWLSWQSESSLPLISSGLDRLVTLAGQLMRSKFTVKKIAVPLLGCGNGGLSRKQVLPLMQSKLTNDFLFVDREM